jgi:hypothetical protein
MMFLSFITLPDPTDLIATTTAWSTVFFDNLIPIIAAVAGIIVGVYFVKFLIGKLVGGVKSLLVRRRGGRGGGRRR